MSAVRVLTDPNYVHKNWFKFKMEGSGEGVLAIFRNLNDGLALTLLSRPRDQPSRQMSSQIELAALKPAYKSSSVETGTDLLYEGRPSRDKQTDGHQYISCYQMSHCQMNPASSPLLFNEFSAQKSKPEVGKIEKGEGTFEIGSPGSSITRADRPAESRWRKRSIVTCNGMSRCMEDFVNSLRKYPTTSPERTASSELLAKVLKYTQNKYYQNETTKKSMRLHPDMTMEETLHKETRNDKIMANMEKRKENRRECTFTARYGLKRIRKPNKSIVRGIFNRKSKPKIKNNVIHSSGLNIMRKDSHLSTNYNYLRCRQPSQQTRLGELGKELQKTLKLICNRHPVVLQICPNIQKRYEKHKKTCTKKSTSAMDTNKTQKKDSVSKLSRLHSAISNICEEPCCSKIMASNYCYCNKATQYISDTDSKNNIRDNICQCCPKMHSQSTQPYKDNLYIADSDRACECRELTDTELNSKIDKAVADWMNEIPVPANENTDDKVLREKAVKELAATLKQIPDDDNLDDNIKEAIENNIDNIPMWKPGAVNEQEHLKEDLVKYLLVNIIPIIKKTDKLSNIVKAFVKSINFMDEEINKQDIIDNIMTKVRQFENNAPVNNNEFKTQLAKDITTILEGLPIRYTEDKITTLNRLSNGLAHDIISYFRNTNVYTDTESLNDTLKKHGTDVFDEKDEYDSMDKKQVVKILKDLTLKIDELESQISSTNKIKSELDSGQQLNTQEMSNDYLSATITDEKPPYGKKQTKFEEAYKEDVFNELDEEHVRQSLLEDNDHKSDVTKEDWRNTKMNTYIEKIPGKNKDVEKHIALEEMKHEIEKVPTDFAKKNYLQNKLKDILDESSDKPFTESVLKDVNERIENLIAETEMDEDTKCNLINKLTDIAKSRLDENTNETRKDYAQRMFLKDLNSNINKMPISQEMKDNLKQTLETKIKENLEQPFSSDVKNIISDNIAEIIENSMIPQHLKKGLKNTLINVADEKFGKLPEQTTVDYAKESLIKGVKYVFDDIPLPREQRKELINDLGRVITESLDQPFSGSVKDNLKATLNDIITKSEIDSATKINLGKKLSNIVNQQLDMLPYQTSEDYAKDEIIRNLMRIVDSKNVSKSERDNLKNKFKDMINASFQHQHLSDVRNNIEEGVNNIIKHMPMSNNEKNELLNAATGIVGKILDESYYNDNLRMQLDDIYSDIDKRQILSPDKSILKNKFKIIVDDHSQDKEFPDVNDLIKEGIQLIEKSDIKNNDEIFVNESIMNDTLKVVDDMQMPHSKKSTLKNKLQDILINNLNKTKNRKDILQELNKTIEKIPLTWTETKSLKSKLANVMAPILNESQKQLRITFLKDIEKAIDEESFSKTKKSSLKNNIAKYLDSLDEPINSQTRNKIKNNLAKIIDENLSAKENRNQQLKNKMDKIVDLLPTELEDANIIKEKVISQINDITDEAWIRPHIKDSMKKQFQSIVEDNFNQPLGKDTSLAIKDAINKIIDGTAISDYQREDLKQKLMGALNTMSSRITTVTSNSIGSRTETKPFFSQPLPHSTLNEEMFDATHDRTDISEISSVPIGEDTKHKPTAKINSKTTLLKDFHDISRDAHLSENKRGALTNALTDAIGGRVDKIYTDPSKDKTVAKKEIETNIGEILNQISVPENQKSIIKSQLMDAVSKYIDTTEIDSPQFGDKRTKLFRNTESIINLLPIVENMKETLRNKLKVIIPDILTLEQKKLEYDGPVTSTPKKSRKTWGEVNDILSTIPDDNLIQFLSPEENDYWTQVIKVMHQWIDNQPVNIDEDTRNRIKKGLLNDIDDRQKYLQMNPAAKKTIQEELENLQYQIYRKLNKVLDDSDMTVVMDATDDLMHAMQEIKPPKAIQDETEKVPCVYQQQLRDLTSGTLAQQEGPSTDELAAFELMKNDLADMFVSLHYSGDNIEQKNRMKDKLYAEINKFCDNYIKSHPELHTNTGKINQDLYNVLKNVSLPPEHSLQTVEEQKKFEDIIDDWVKKMPLKEQTAMEKLKMSREAAYLAKSLKDIKRNDDKLSYQEVKQNMAKEIMQFMKKLPLKEDQKKGLDKYSQKLIAMLESIDIAGQVDTCTEVGDDLSRLDNIRQYNRNGTDSFDLDGIRQSTRIGAGSSLLDGIRRLSQIDGDLSRDGIRHFDTLQPNVDRHLSGLDDIQEHAFPPCYLTTEDKDHLRRIKKRACLAPDCTTSLLRNHKQDASVNPMENETGSQTDLDLPYLDRSSVPRTCRMTIKSKPVRATTPCTDKASQIEVQPQVIVKEYFWDSVNTPTSTLPTNYHGRENCKCRRNSRRRLLFESANICPAAKNVCHRLTDGMAPQKCQDWPSSQRPRSPSPASDNLIIENSFRQSNIADQLSPRMSPDIKSDKESRRNSSPENIDPSTSRYLRKEGITETGSPKDRHPSRRTNAGSSNFDWCSKFPEEAWKPPCVRREMISDVGKECMTRYSCKDRTKSPPRDIQRCFRRNSRTNCGVGPCADHSGEHWSTFCEPCARCPYPSYLYFRQ